MDWWHSPELVWTLLFVLQTLIAAWIASLCWFVRRVLNKQDDHGKTLAEHTERLARIEGKLD